MGRFLPPLMVCKVGDHVRWISVSRGVPHHHTGVVVAVVPGGTMFGDLAGVDLPPKFSQQFRGQCRPDDSYLVAHAGRLYWPRVKHLRPY